MNEFVISRQDEQIQELLELLEDMQKETEQKDEVSAVKEADPFTDNGITEAVKRISEIKRETQQREQSREYSSIKERLEAKKRIVAEREKEAGKSRKRHQETSR